VSNQSPYGRTNAAFPSLPRGDVLGTYETYPEAQRVVAKLAESDFPVKQVAIVGNDLKTVERVTGKLTYGRAAIAGALSGLWLGIFFGIVLTLFSRGASGGTIIAAAIIGAAFGMLYGVVSFSITKRQRDFTSVHQVLATNYQIVVDPQLIGQAQQILGSASAGWTPQQPQQTQHTQPWSPPPGADRQQRPAQQQQPPQQGQAQQQRPPQQAPLPQQQRPPQPPQERSAPTPPQYGAPLSEGQRRPEPRHDQPPYGQRTERPQYGENAPQASPSDSPSPKPSTSPEAASEDTDKSGDTDKTD
jgi:hypothetical protein